MVSICGRTGESQGASHVSEKIGLSSGLDSSELDEFSPDILYFCTGEGLHSAASSVPRLILGSHTYGLFKALRKFAPSLSAPL